MTEDIIIEVSNGAESIEFRGQRNETILSSALRQGVALRYHCASGICATCRVSLQTGSVAIADAESDTPIHANDRGQPADVLLCKARPLTDCTMVAPYSLEELSKRFIQPAYFDGTVDTLQHLGGNLYELSVRLSDDMPFNPGQYALISIDNGNVCRAYSMASYCPGASSHRYIIALNEKGSVSKLLCAADIVGQKLSLFGPLGHCYPYAGEFKDIVLIVGGSGVSVALAMLEWYQSNALDQNGMSLKIFWGVRALHNSTLLNALDDAVSTESGPSITVCYDTCPDAAAQKNKKQLRFFEGNPADAATEDDTLTIDESTGVFISGSSAFVEHVTRVLMLETCVEPSNIRSDSFA